MSLTITERNTSFTQLHDKVMVKKFGSRDGIYREIYHFKQLSNVDQMDHIISNIILNNGFIADKYTGDMIVFTHPKNSMENTTWYEYDTKEHIIKKYEHIFLSYV